MLCLCEQFYPCSFIFNRYQIPTCSLKVLWVLGSECSDKLLFTTVDAKSELSWTLVLGNWSEQLPFLQMPGTHHGTKGTDASTSF